MLTVHSGTYSDTALAHLEGIVLRTGETTDVGTLDLTGVLTMHVLGPDGAALKSFHFTFGEDISTLVEDQWRLREQRASENGVLRLPRETAVVNVAVCAPGLRAKIFMDVHGGDILHMTRGLAIALRISNPVATAPLDTQFSVEVIRADLARRSGSHEFLETYRADFDPQGEARLIAPEPGRYVLRWILTKKRAGGSFARSWQDPPQYIELLDEVEPQVFKVHCPIDPATAFESK